jgi:hypothetical protein
MVLAKAQVMSAGLFTGEVPVNHHHSHAAGQEIVTLQAPKHAKSSA